MSTARISPTERIVSGLKGVLQMRHVVDRVADYLRRDEEVPIELAAELVAKLPADERSSWLRVAIAMMHESVAETAFWRDQEGA